MLYEYLIQNYKPLEPILVSDINLPVTDVNLRQMFKVLCDSGKIKRFGTGVYYLPKVSPLKGEIPLNADVVAKYKYVEKRGIVDGYYSGYTFANQIGLTTQVPYIAEIVSNNASATVRELNLNGRRVILRKSRTLVNKSNYKVLQLLDLLKDSDLYIDCKKGDAVSKIRKYILDEKIKKSDIDSYLSYYPDRIYKTLYEMRLYEVFA